MEKLCRDGLISVYGFFAGAGLLILFLILDLCILLDLGSEHISTGFTSRLVYLAIWFVAINILLRLKVQGNNYRIAWRAALIGFVFAVGTTIASGASDSWRCFGIYGMFLAMFHYTEFLAIAVNNPKTLSVESFILNHSTSYHIAAVSSCIEFVLETNFYPGIKTYWILWLIGTLMCLGGEVLRKVAMWQAAHNFTHVVRFEQVDNHRLVKHGVYAFMRHPSYVGWFYWSIGTQIILGNPICLIIYAIASWKFFHERIFMEEITLLNFFGEEYYKYQQAVPTGLPFIRGYKLEL